MIYNVVLVLGSQKSNSVIYIHTHIHTHTHIYIYIMSILFLVLFHYRLFQDIEYNFLCYNSRFCCLSVFPPHPFPCGNHKFVFYASESVSVLYFVFGFHIFFIHSSVSGQLGYFHVLAIVNSASVNIGGHISFQIRVYLFWVHAQEWDC